MSRLKKLSNVPWRCQYQKLMEIGLHLGIGESGVSQACRRVAQKIEKDKKPKKRLLDWKSKSICLE
jgi:hypothetical protein